MRWLSDRSVWRVQLRQIDNDHIFTKEAEIVVSCVGSISIPKDCTIPGYEDYNGKIWHSARWNHRESMKGKTVAVVGNGCSAAQLVPHVVESASRVVQFQRSPQWINDRPNSRFTKTQKLCFRYMPFANKLYRFYLWKRTDALHKLYTSTSSTAINARVAATKSAINYMKSTAPEKYHDILIPKFPLGCKRRIFDPGYLVSLHSPKIELTTESIESFTNTGLRTTKRELDFDIVILSTGFKIQDFLTPIKIIGKDNVSINEHWRSTNGAQAYKATFVTGFPNFAMVFGPNAFPAHNSVIYTNEVQVEYIIKSMFKPMLMGSFSVIDVKESAEHRDASEVQHALKSMVWSSGCSNWNLNASGRNTTNYHDETWKFWYRLWWPVWKDFELSGGNGASLPWRPEWKVAGSVLGTIAASMSLWLTMG